MNNKFKKIKSKFEELNLSFRGKYEDINESLTSWWLQDGEGESLTDEEKEFKKYVEDTFGFKQVKHYSGPDYDDWSQGSEVEGFTVIQLDGVYFKLIYEMSSYGGIHCDDFWDWKEVTKVNKELTFYE